MSRKKRKERNKERKKEKNTGFDSLLILENPCDEVEVTTPVIVLIIPFFCSFFFI